jgi:nitrate reductase cytochrome c-type subunit
VRSKLRCVHSELIDHPIVFQRSDDEEDEQRGEEEWRGEEAQNVGEGANEEEDESEEDEAEENGSEEEAEVERVMRQTQRSHVVAPPIVPHRKRIGF